jgi:hypothetical protein
LIGGVERGRPPPPRQENADSATDSPAHPRWPSLLRSQRGVNREPTRIAQSRAAPTSAPAGNPSAARRSACDDGLDADGSVSGSRSGRLGASKQRRKVAAARTAVLAQSRTNDQGRLPRSRVAQAHERQRATPRAGAPQSSLRRDWARPLGVATKGGHGLVGGVESADEPFERRSAGGDASDSLQDLVGAFGGGGEEEAGQTLAVGFGGGSDAPFLLGVDGEVDPPAPPLLRICQELWLWGRLVWGG